MPTIAAAVKFLRMALVTALVAALIEHPQYLNPDKIGEDLLLESLT